MATDHPISLVKFASIREGKHILSKGSLRWSSPELFQGPFELRYDQGLEFSKKELLRSVIRTIAAMVFARDMPAPGLPDHPFSKLIRRWRVEDRFNSEEEVEEALSNIVDNMIDRQMEEFQEIIDYWKYLISHVRLISLYDKHQDLSFWEQLADNHKGIAIRFRCDAENSPLGGAKRADYNTKRPQITTLKEQVNVLIGQVRMTDKESLQEKLLVRPKARALEKEWICYKVLSEEEFEQEQAEHGDLDAKKWYQDVKFTDKELSAVYFGAEVSDKDKKTILEFLGKNYPKVKAFEAQIHEDEYALEFEPLPLIRPAKAPQENNAGQGSEGGKANNANTEAKGGKENDQTKTAANPNKAEDTKAVEKPNPSVSNDEAANTEESDSNKGKDIPRTNSKAG